MSNNIRPEMIEPTQCTDPNYKGVTSVTQRIMPLAQNFTVAGDMVNNLEFQYVVPNGYRQDLTKSYILFDAKIAVAAGTALVTSAPAWNMPATFFSTARLELNDYLVAMSNNVPQDDTVMKRLLRSYVYNKSANSGSFCYGSDTDRFNAVQTLLTQELAWRPDCLYNYEMVIPSNVKVKMSLAVHPLLHTAASSPAFVSKTDAACDGTIKFNNMYYVASFVKTSIPIPRELFLPAYRIHSSYQSISGTSNNLQFTVPRETYKIILALQSNAATVNAGAVATKFSSGSGLAGATQSAYSYFLTGLQLRYAGQSYPASQYSILESAAATKSMTPYMDYIASTDSVLDPAGSETYLEWSDSKVLADAGLGRMFCFNIVKPTNSTDTNCEVTVTFSTGPTTTRLWLFAVSKAAIGVKYGDNESIEEVKQIPFS